MTERPESFFAWADRVTDAEEAREQLTMLGDRIENLALGLDMSARATAPSKKSEIERGCAQALRGLLRRDGEAVADSPLAAIMHFADTFRNVLPELPDTYSCTWTCAEANAAADLYRALGDDTTAELIVANHAHYDQEGDEHYRPKPAEPRTGLDKVQEAVRKARGGDPPTQIRGFA